MFHKAYRYRDTPRFSLSSVHTRRCSSKRGYRVPAVAMLNLTHGEQRKHGLHHQPQAAAAAATPPPRNPWQQQAPGYSHHGGRQGQALGSYSALLRQGAGRPGMMAPPQVSVAAASICWVWVGGCRMGLWRVSRSVLLLLPFTGWGWV